MTQSDLSDYQSDGGESYKDEETLRRLYYDEGLTLAEVGERLGCSDRTVSYWMEKYNTGPASKPKPYQDKEKLERLYHDEKMSTNEIADEWGVGESTILRWLKRHEIAIRRRGEGVSLALSKSPVRLFTDRGYELWEHTYRGERDKIAVHRLLAVAKFGFSEVIEKDVHHKDGVPWHNVYENLELLGHSEHTAHHNPRQLSKSEAEEFRRRYQTENISQKSLGEEYGISDATANRVVNRNGGY
jgi:transposase